MLSVCSSPLEALAPSSHLKDRHQRAFLFFEKIPVIAHRGFTGGATSRALVENTREMYQQAVDIGAPMLELDVQLSKDGVAVVFHDATPWRLGGMQLQTLIAEMTWAELQDLDLVLANNGDRLQNPAKIMRFDDVLREFGPKIAIDIELKMPWDDDREILEAHKDKNGESLYIQYMPDQELGKNYRRQMAKTVIDLVKKYQLESSVVFSSFDYWILEHIHENYRDSNPWISLGYLHEDLQEYHRDAQKDSFHAVIDVLVLSLDLLWQDGQWTDHAQAIFDFVCPVIPFGVDQLELAQILLSHDRIPSVISDQSADLLSKLNGYRHDLKTAA